MKLNPAWRVLTIGDGDLSFSRALYQHHNINRLHASVLDSKVELLIKYQNNAYFDLAATNIDLSFHFDVTNKHTWPLSVQHAFDLVIFQFPLVPSSRNRWALEKGLTPNLVNRSLLSEYLINCQNHFLDPNGERIAMITSKDVKPYSHWHIETSITMFNNMNYLGRLPFNIEEFPGYQVRNVDRDKHVKDTLGHYYIYSDNPAAQIAPEPESFAYDALNMCELCYVGPFTSNESKDKHLASKKHKQMTHYKDEWLKLHRCFPSSD